MAIRPACILMFIAACPAAAFGQGPGGGLLPPAILQPPDQTPPDPTDPAPFPPPPAGTFLPEGSRVNLPPSTRQTIQFTRRYGTLGQIKIDQLDDGSTRLVDTEGMLVRVQYQTGNGPFQEYEFAADRVVVWVRGISGQNLANGVTVESDKPNAGAEVELFLAGNVVIRSQETRLVQGARSQFQRVMRADQIYYDVKTNRAIALEADLEYQTPGVLDNLRVRGRTVEQRGRGDFRVTTAGAHASRLPSDPSVQFRASELTLVETDRTRRTFLGIPYQRLFPNAPEPGAERILTGRNARVELLGIPIFYTPYYRADASEPLGPLSGIGFGSNQIFGTQVFTNWDVYRAIGVTAPPGHTWRFSADYLSDRGTAFGTNYSFANADFFGFGRRNSGYVRLWGLNDRGQDNLGGFRGPEPRITDPAFRGRAFARYQQELFADRDPDTGLLTGDRFLGLQSQFAWLSDKNFLEQYFKNEFDFGPNQETFLYLHGSSGHWYGNVLAQGGQDREWTTETRKLPRAAGGVVGQSLFDIFSYISRAEAGYFELRPATQPPPPYQPFQRTDVRSSLGRADWWNELSLPMQAGPTTITPYGVLNLTGYTEDLTGESAGRLYAGGGVRTATTLSRLYPGAASELFNVRGLNHKLTLSGNYFAARSDTPYTRLPLLDRLNDDAIDQAFRTTKPFQGEKLNDPAAIQALMFDPIYDPQRYALRRLALENIDSRDDIQVMQTGVSQRLQTKRGFVGREHTVDWLTLDVSASFFPDRVRDNFDERWAFLEYNSVWNVGDRTALVTSGWFDPFRNGVRYYNVGAYHARPDGTDYTLTYRQTDPLNSKMVSFNVGYKLTSKYAIQAGAGYDFGLQQSVFNTLTLTRTGPDLTFTLGVTYNPFQNNLGFQFAVVPNLAAARGGVGVVGPSNFAGR